jgi:hypothetical protein
MHLLWVIMKSWVLGKVYSRKKNETNKNPLSKIFCTGCCQSRNAMKKISDFDIIRQKNDYHRQQVCGKLTILQSLDAGRPTWGFWGRPGCWMRVGACGFPTGGRLPTAVPSNTALRIRNVWFAKLQFKKKKQKQTLSQHSFQVLLLLF